MNSHARRRWFLRPVCMHSTTLPWCPVQVTILPADPYQGPRLPQDRAKTGAPAVNRTPLCALRGRCIAAMLQGQTGAGTRDRTPGIRLTRAALYRLSYASKIFRNYRTVARSEAAFPVGRAAGRPEGPARYGLDRFREADFGESCPANRVSLLSACPAEVRNRCRLVCIRPGDDRIIVSATLLCARKRPLAEPFGLGGWFHRYGGQSAHGAAFHKNSVGRVNTPAPGGCQLSSDEIVQGHLVSNYC